NASAAGALLDPVREIFGDRNVGRGLAAFADEVGAPRALRELGLKKADLSRAADLAMEAACWTPPAAGAERNPRDAEGGLVGRASSLIRPDHKRPVGEAEQADALRGSASSDASGRSSARAPTHKRAT